MTEPLVCPSCATTHPLNERFCPACGMPLVYSGRTGVDEPVTEAHARARKIKPQFTEGELVRVVSAHHQAEAEMVQGILLEEGIPSMTRRSAGFDVPDMLAAGWPGVEWLIVGLRRNSEEVVVRSYRIDDGRVSEVEVVGA